MAETNRTKNITISEMDKAAKKCGEELNKQTKRKVKIKSKGAEDKAAVPVCINGYVFMIPKDTAVEVPEAVAKLLEEADYI